MEAFDISDAKAVVRQIVDELRAGRSPLALPDPAARYAKHCEAVNRRLARCGELLKEGAHREHEVLMEAMRSPDLREWVACLQDPALRAWREACDKQGMQTPPPIDFETFRAVEAVFARLGYGRVPARSADPGRQQAGEPGPVPKRSKPMPEHAAPRESNLTATAAVRSSRAGSGAASKSSGNLACWLTTGAVAVVLVGGGALVLPGRIERSEAIELSATLDELMARGRWDEARERVAAAGDLPAKRGGELPLLDSLQALDLGEQYRNLGPALEPASLNPEALLNRIDASAAALGIDVETHPQLAIVRNRALEQIRHWQDFQQKLSQSWTALARFELDRVVTRNETDAHLADQEPDPKERGRKMQQRLDEAGRQARQFLSIKKDASENPAATELPYRLTIRQQTRQIAERLQRLEEEADPEASRALQTMAAIVSSFEPPAAKEPAETSPPIAGEPGTEKPSAAGGGDAPKQEPDGGGTPPAKSEPEVKPATPKKEDAPPNDAPVLPPTFLTLWQPDHRYSINLGKAGVKPLPNAKFASIAVPPRLDPESGTGDAPWTPLVGNQIRQSLSGTPVFQWTRKNDHLLLEGRLTEAFRKQFADSYLVGFVEDKMNDRADYRVLVCRPGPGPESDIGLYRFPATGNLVRDAVDPKQIRLSDALGARLGHLILSGSDDIGGRLAMSLAWGDVALSSSPIEFAEGAIPFSQLRLSLELPGNLKTEIERVEAGLKALEDIEKANQAFEGSFAHLGDSEKLFRNIGRFEIQTAVRPSSSSSSSSISSSLAFEKLQRDELPHSTLKEFTDQQGSARAYPIFLDYLEHLIDFVLKNEGILFGFAKEDKQQLQSFKRFPCPGGWKRERDSDRLRKKWKDLTDYAAQRKPNLPASSRDSVPSQNSNESAEEYLNRLNQIRRGANSDHLFDNLRDAFAESAVNAVWPALEHYDKLPDLPDHRAELEKQREAVEKKKQTAMTLETSPLEKLGDYSIECEIIRKSKASGKTSTETNNRLRLLILEAENTGEVSPHQAKK